LPPTTEIYTLSLHDALPICELNRLGLTSAIDAGGGFQNYPEDYQVIDQLHRRGEMTVRIAYNLFTQRPSQELDDFSRWVTMTRRSEEHTSELQSRSDLVCRL